MRQADDHLTDDDLDALLGTAPEAHVGALADAREHVRVCEECRTQLSRTRTLYAGLGSLPTGMELSDARVAAQVQAIERRLAGPSHDEGRRMHPGIRAALFTAAAAVLLIAGIGVGRWSVDGERGASPAITSSSDAVLALQQAGSAYIAAIVRLDVAAADDDSLRVVGREVALSTLYGAAAEAARLAPADAASTDLVAAARTARQRMMASRTAGAGVRSF